jgi:hypothetical protein
MIQELFANPKKSKGQILVMYAIMLLVLIAIMGLAIDVGYVYVSYARLRRAVDSAALNASNQIKEGYEHEDLEAAAMEFLQLNGIDVDISDPDSVRVDTCDTDVSMCTTPERKLVNVWAAWDVPTFFMSVLGFETIRISAEAESEAATIDVILVFDVSESMTYDYPDGHPLRDPWLCSELNACMPFETLKGASKDFVEELYFPYDRVAIVTFGRYAETVVELTNEKQDILNAIDSLGVYSGVPCPIYDEGVYTTTAGDIPLAEDNSVCRRYSEDEGADETFLPVPYGTGTRWSTPAEPDDEDNWPFKGMFCPQTRRFLLGQADMNALRGHCNSTNMGAGLAMAGNLLAGPDTRDESLWVVIVLADGAANIAYSEGTLLCPVPGECRLNKPGTRYSADTNPNQYDPDDYARDMADFLYGMEVYTFGIGLGPGVDNPTALALMDYVIAPTDHPQYQAPARGIYYVAPTGAELREIFLQIANNIATRITR